MGRSNLSRRWKERALVLALLLLGAGLRLWNVGVVPPGLYHDEAQHGLDALEVLEDGRLPLYFPANNGREPLFIYLVTVSVALLGRSPMAIRLPAFFVGFLTLAATYDLAKVLWGQRAGRWALAVLACTFWHVHLSRVGFRAVLLPLFTALFLAQVARALRTRRYRHWLAAGALYGASWYTYMAARFTPVAMGVMVLYGLLFHCQQIRGMWRGALIFCIAALVVLSPLGIYTLIYPDIVLSRSGQVSILSPEINNGDLWGTLAKHILRTVEMFFVRGDRIWRHNLAWRPVWEPALGLAFVIGVGVALAGFRRNVGAALALLWTATMALPTLLAEDAPHFLRGVGVLPTAVLFPVLGLMWMESKVQSPKSKVQSHATCPRSRGSRFTLHASERYVSVLALRRWLPFLAQHLQRGNEARAALSRIDDVVEIASRGRNEGRRQFLAVMPGQIGPCYRRIIGGGQILAEDDVDGAFWPHHGDFGVRPRQIDVARQMLGTHHDVCTAISFAQDQ